MQAAHNPLLWCTLICSAFMMGCPVSGPSPDPTPVAVLSAEEQAFIDQIEPISDPRLAEFYADFADVVRRDTEIIKTTDHLRTGHSRAGRLMFQETGMKGKYPGLAEAVDGAIEAAIGRKNVPLTSEMRQSAVEILEAISRAAL